MKKGRPFTDWEKGLRSGNPAPLHVFLGPEVFFFEAGLTLAEERLNESGEAVDREMYWGSECDSSALLSQVDTCPMTMAIRLVGIRELEKAGKKDLDRWAGYCRSPAEWNVLFLQISSPLPIGTTIESTLSSDRALSNMGRSVASWLVALSATRTPPRTMLGTTAS